MAKRGIFCLEGEWEEDRLTDRKSVRPGLDMLMAMRDDQLIHRNAATAEEFKFYFSRWASHRYDAFPLAYLASHGSRGWLNLGGDFLSLANIADFSSRQLKNRIIYFGACETLGATDSQLKKFVERTGVKAIVGYTRQVSWAESAAFDFTLLPALLDDDDVWDVYTRLYKQHPHFVEGLGLRMATPDWVSERIRVRK
ncbi:DUF6642 family protein [Geodermatophilus sp. SYSU D01105]